MVRLENVQGRVYTLKSKSECLASGILAPVDPDLVRGHMVLVLDVVPGKKDHVKIMTITSTLKTDGDYVPISPTPKKGFAIQLRLRNHLGLNHREIVLFITTLTKSSYLKIDSCYEVPVQMLVEARDSLNNPLMIWAKHRGGLGELRAHVRRRNQIREEEKLYRMMEKSSLEEDGV